MATLRTATAFAVALLLAAGTAAANGLEVPGPELRILGWTDEASTSECIGDPRTPLCAVETYGACTDRADWPLCDLVGRPVPESTRQLRHDRSFELSSTVYQVLGQRRLEAADIPPERTRGTRPWQAGDVALLIQWHDCSPTDQCVMETRNDTVSEASGKCPPTRCRGRLSRIDPVVGPEPRTFILRLVGERWQVIDNPYRAGLPASFWGR